MSTVYDFSTTGPGTFTFDSVPRFQAAGLDGTAKTTATDGVSKREGDLEKRTTVNCKDQSEAKLLKDSLVESRDLIFVVAFYIDAYTVNDPIYKDYFGSNTAESVLKGFGAIFNQQSSSKVLACGDASERCSGSIASYTDDNQTLYFCPLFFLACYPADWLCKGASVDEEGVRGGIVISQLAYALMNAQEFKGGCSDSRDLPDEQKLINAANYEVILVPFVVYPALAY